MAGSSNRTIEPNVIIIHTGEGILNRNDMAKFLDGRTDASAHAAGDADGVVAPLVPYSRAAWTAGPTGNNRGIQIELCAFAVMSRQQWLSKEDVVVWIPWLNANRTIRSPYRMLQHAANWIRTVANEYDISKQKINATQLRAGASGICGHADVSEAWKESDHTDPGAGFPWDVFIELINEGGSTEVSAEDVRVGLFNTRHENRNLFDWFKQAGWDQDYRTNKILESLNNLAKMIGSVNDVDEAAIAKALIPAVVAALPSQLNGLDDSQIQRIAEAVNDELAKRQAS